MPTVVQIRRGSTETISPYIGPVGEVVFNTSTGRLHVQDGVTPGGIIAARLSDSGGGSGDGDMSRSVYDPTGKAADAFSMDNMVESSTSKVLTADERAKLAGVSANATQNSADSFLLALENATGNLPQSRVENLTSSLASRQSTSQKNVANGYAGLDADGKLSATQLPPLAITDTFEVANQSAMLALSQAQKGDIAVRSDVNSTFILAAEPYSVLVNWVLLKTPTDSVISVAGLQGVITAAQLKTALTLDNVNNTSDANKPISTATQTALDAKWGSTTSSIDYGVIP